MRELGDIIFDENPQFSPEDTKTFINGFGQNWKEHPITFLKKMTEYGVKLQKNDFKYLPTDLHILYRIAQHGITISHPHTCMLANFLAEAGSFARKLNEKSPTLENLTNWYNNTLRSEREFFKHPAHKDSAICAAITASYAGDATFELYGKTGDFKLAKKAYLLRARAARRMKRTDMRHYATECSFAADIARTLFGKEKSERYAVLSYGKNMQATKELEDVKRFKEAGYSAGFAAQTAYGYFDATGDPTWGKLAHKAYLIAAKSIPSLEQRSNMLFYAGNTSFRLWGITGDIDWLKKSYENNITSARQTPNKEKALTSYKSAARSAKRLKESDTKENWHEKYQDAQKNYELLTLELRRS